MNTSNFAKHGGDPNAVAICRRPPHWFKGQVYKKLAPSSELLRQGRKNELTTEGWKQAYVEQVLDKLDPTVVVSELGPGVIMLCFEGAGKPCHRHYVAEWLRDAGFDCTELDKGRPRTKRASKAAPVTYSKPQEFASPQDKLQRCYERLLEHPIHSIFAPRGEIMSIIRQIREALTAGAIAPERHMRYVELVERKFA